MRKIDSNCPSCGANMLQIKDNIFKCNFCGKTVILDYGSEQEINSLLFGNMDDLIEICDKKVNSLESKHNVIFDFYNDESAIDIEWPKPNEEKYNGLQCSSRYGITPESTIDFSEETSKEINDYVNTVEKTRDYGMLLFRYADVLDSSIPSSKEDIDNLRNELAELYLSALGKEEQQKKL